MCIYGKLSLLYRIIQSFIMREHAGALAPPSFDENKVLLARKGGVMGSVFSGKSRISDITLDLSLEMNRKMQSVLEDTLLKNITLKVRYTYICYTCVCSF